MKTTSMKCLTTTNLINYLEWILDFQTKLDHLTKGYKSVRYQSSIDSSPLLISVQGIDISPVLTSVQL